MKNKTILFLMLIFISYLSKSQPEYGIIAGANLFNFDKSKYGTQQINKGDYDFGFLYPSVGIYYRNSVINNWIDYNIALMYNPKGADLGIPYVSGVGYDPNAPHVIERLNYISLPIDLILFSNWKFNLVAGMETGYLISRTDEIVTPFTNDNKFDLAYRLGFNYQFGKVGLKVVYSKSLNHVIDRYYGSDSGFKYSNRGVQATLSVPLSGLINKK